MELFFGKKARTIQEYSKKLNPINIQTYRTDHPQLKYNANKRYYLLVATISKWYEPTWSGVRCTSDDTVDVGNGPGK